jgi:hypothetical protein
MKPKRARDSIAREDARATGAKFSTSTTGVVSDLLWTGAVILAF